VRSGPQKAFFEQTFRTCHVENLPFHVAYTFPSANFQQISAVLARQFVRDACLSGVVFGRSAIKSFAEDSPANRFLVSEKNIERTRIPIDKIREEECCRSFRPSYSQTVKDVAKAGRNADVQR